MILRIIELKELAMRTKMRAEMNSAACLEKGANMLMS